MDAELSSWWRYVRSDPHGVDFTPLPFRGTRQTRCHPAIWRDRRGKKEIKPSNNFDLNASVS